MYFTWHMDSVTFCTNVTDMIWRTRYNWNAIDYAVIFYVLYVRYVQDLTFCTKDTYNTLRFMQKLQTEFDVWDINKRWNTIAYALYVSMDSHTFCKNVTHIIWRTGYNLKHYWLRSYHLRFVGEIRTKLDVLCESYQRNLTFEI
jgi:hypothetical protein